MIRKLKWLVEDQMMMMMTYGREYSVFTNYVVSQVWGTEIAKNGYYNSTYILST